MPHITKLYGNMCHKYNILKIPPIGMALFKKIAKWTYNYLLAFFFWHTDALFTRDLIEKNYIKPS